MKWIPPEEGYQPLPPNSPEDNYHGEIYNQSNVGSVATPLLENSKRALVTVENTTPHTTPMLTAYIEPLLLQLGSLGNVIEEEVPVLPERPIFETYMVSMEPIFGDDYRTPIHPTITVDTHHTLSHSCMDESIRT